VERLASVAGARTGAVLIVEDHEMLAEALALSLGARGLKCRVADLDGGESVLSQAASQRPALVLLDLDLGDVDGLDLVPQLRELGANVVIVTGETSGPRLAASVALGATGWVSKSEPFERLLEAAEVVLGGRSLFSAARKAELVEAGWANLTAQRRLVRQLADLTAREAEVLAQLREGKGAEEIAEALFISLGTVRSHIRGILTKLGVSSQLAAVAKARELAGSR
jgi:DNA-binding NarL/FixJ family response regulator